MAIHIRLREFKIALGSAAAAWRLAARSPWQNGYVERLIGSIRRECTDHLIVFNAEHLRRILSKYTT